MRRNIILVWIFCAVSLSIHKLKEEKKKELFFGGEEFLLERFGSGEEEAREERKSDHPSEFVLLNHAIRTKDGQDEPGYQPGYRLKELTKAQEARIASRQRLQGRIDSNNGVLEWKERGPANVPGRTLALLDLPGDSNHKTWLAGAATGGVWKTLDGGNTWVEKSKNFSVLPISSLAMSEEPNTKTIYAGTGEFVSTSNAAVGDGIFKSTDLGETWTQLSSTAANKNFLVVTRIIVNPTNANVLLASCISAPYAGATDKKSTIQKSIDGGATWTTVFQSKIAIEQVAFTPGNFNILYATLRATGVVKSLDEGATWDAVNTGLSPKGRIEIAISPVKTTRIFASAEGNLTGTGSDLYLSDDAGASWSLVDVSLNSAAVDFLGGQGFYDNTIACDPFNQDAVYVGGVNYFKLTLGTGSSTINNYTLEETKTTPYVTLVVANGVTYGDGKLSVYNNPNISVELRFGADKKQKAHRFLVPAGQSSGVPDANYTYQDYVDVDFEAWDVTNNKQLMVSFRDQGRDGKFNLIPLNTDNSDVTLQSREYIYVHNVAYNATIPQPTITVNGGHKIGAVYNIWPVLSPGATWPVTQNVSLGINVVAVPKLNATTVTVADAYTKWDGKNKVNQTDFTQGVHPDHHFTLVIPVDKVLKTYKLLIGNDGGVFYSNASTTPAIVDGDLKFAGYGYNTGQFYSADKRPGVDQYLGGLQDNGTRYSPNGESSSAKTNYNYGLAGDGFEALWNSLDATKMLGSIYYGNINKSNDGGVTWVPSITGLTGAGNSANFPFFTKLSNSKKYPDRVFTIGTSGVYVSNNFGSTWALTPITSNFSGNSPSADIEVSQSNASIVWAGSGMSSTRNLYVSTDAGKSFTKTINYSGATLGALTRLSSHPTQDSTAFAMFSFADSPKILRTKDLGKTWTDISGFGTSTTSNNGFPNVAVFCLYVRPDNPNIIWAGTEVGIVESLDEGKTWNILSDFPHVNVWDMKGQDDQVVIATHGRGIWSAKINGSQVVVTRPSITAAGTSPQSKFLIQTNQPIAYDSMVVYINSVRVGSQKKIPAGNSIFTVTGVPTGNVTSQLVAYLGNSAIQSSPYVQNQLNLKTAQSQYFNLFSNGNDFIGFNSSTNSNSFSVKTLSSPNLSLQSNHNYDLNATLIAVLLQPIIVSSANPNIFYRDVALVVNDGDYVVVEGTTDGLTWKPLIANYNSSANQAWATAVSAGAVGTDAMQVDHTLKLTPTFSVGDVILIRFRLSSNTSTTAWGWSIDDLYIQQTPTGLENLLPSYKELNFSVFPNPANSNVRIAFNLLNESPVNLSVFDFAGKVVTNINLGTRAKGDHEEALSVSLPQGIYLVKIRSNDGYATQRLFITD